MIVCEWEFLDEDPRRKGYSLEELDFYQWTRSADGVPSHRLTLVKNLANGRFELWRSFVHRIVSDRAGARTVAHVDAHRDEIVLSTPSFDEALRRGNDEFRRFHRVVADVDEPCDHKMRAAVFCPATRPRKPGFRPPT